MENKQSLSDKAILQSRDQVKEGVLFEAGDVREAVKKLKKQSSIFMKEGVWFMIITKEDFDEILGEKLTK